MQLVTYTVNPPNHLMPGVAIAFADVFFLDGNDDNDVIHVVFNQPNSQDWVIFGPTTRAFPVHHAGTHTQLDGLVFQCVGQRIPGAVFAVTALASLASAPGIQRPAVLFVTVQ